MGGRALILLDTHAWIWLHSDPKRISDPARAAIDDARQLYVCAISAWELTTKVRRGRITIDRDARAWVGQALASPRMSVLPITAEIATAAGLLSSEFPGDPADRLIVATALEHRYQLITKDRYIRAYAKTVKDLRVVW